MSNSTSWKNCWRVERIGEVINKEALSVDLATFLATHVPMRKIVYERSPKQMIETSEESLLAELNAQKDADQHLFAVLKGIPGTGKSHLIRWLKEQYALAHPNDAVLLIARANTSLRTTIQQIIDSQIFNSNELPDALKRLQGAVDVLNQETLSEKLINSLQEAKNIFSWTEVCQRLESSGASIHRRVTEERINHFLLDHQVRQQLCRADGPIERVTSFLTSGRDNTMGVEQIPGFVESDFDFNVDVLRRIRTGGGYRDVLEFCNDLHQKEEIRESLTRYLNHVLHTHAISSATQLAAGDLRSMFTDLRRYLRQQGKSLALFIEDITAFTGIDEGLVEVLVTQHRGESNDEFCRLLSVIGITDSYFADRFPDNVKDRVTHQLTLNAKSGRNESDLLQDKAVLIEFAARYLNAIRATDSDLRSWSEHGARPDALPNACEECPVRQTCHAAFGAVELRNTQNGQSPQVVGLYPFNHKSLTTLYDFLKEGMSKTPRTFLNSLLAYILQSHSDKIEAGEFPPPATELANDVTLPTFNPVPHLRVIQEQAGSQAKRIESLLLFWGERNVFSTQQGSSRRVGGVLTDVFAAFKLKSIEGVPQQSTEVVDRAAQTTPANNSPKTPTAKSQVPVTAPRDTANTVSANRYTERISDWANGGKLFAYDRFTDWIADLVRSFIDWQAHGISATQVTEYVTGSRFAIEDQSGAVTKGRQHLLFKRTDELRFVLQALADLNDSAVVLEPSQLSDHLVTLSIWIRSQEERIIDFVREPTLQATQPGLLTDILLQNCIVLACLSGELIAEALNNPQKLYEHLIASCARSSKENWAVKIEQARESHVGEWATLMRNVNTGDAVHICRSELLQLLNRPQGASTNVRFLDAATAFKRLEQFDSEDWRLTPLSVQLDTNDRIWASAVKVHAHLCNSFKLVLNSACGQIRTQRTQLSRYLGDAATGTVFKEIHETLTVLGEIKSYPTSIRDFFVRNDVNLYSLSEQLDHLMQQTDNLLQQNALHEQAILLSEHNSDWVILLKTFSEQFDRLSKLFQEQNLKLGEEMKVMSTQSNAEGEYSRVLQRFDDIMADLSRVVTKEVAQ